MKEVKFMQWRKWVATLFLIAVFAFQAGPAPADTSSQQVSINGNHFEVNGGEIWFNGINTPWHLFDDFGRTDFNEQWWTDEFARYKANHINLARVWIHGSGEVSPDIDESGHVSGVSDLFWQHMDHLFAVARSNGVFILPALFSFDITKDTYSTHARWRAFLQSPSNIQSYIDNVLIPLLARYENEPYLLGWEICNEPEWMFENSEHGPQSFEDVQRLHAMIAAAVHKNSANLVTTGSAAPKWNSPIYDSWGDNEGNMFSDQALTARIDDADAHLDFYQYHWYPWQTQWMESPFTQTTAEYEVDDRPVIVGESEGNDVCDSYICQTLVEMYENAYANGFDGVCAWKTPQNDGHGTFENIAVATNAFFDNHPALVKPAGAAPIPVTGISIPDSEIDVETGQIHRLTAVLYPVDATDQRVTWTSDNPTVASVDNNGLVTGITAGNATVTATTSSGSFSATCSVTVIQGSAGNGYCNNPQSVALPVKQDGSGDFCWVTTGDITNINSWNMELVEINGVDFTNRWTNTMPDTSDGVYFIHYKGTYPWSHLEVNGSGGSADNSGNGDGTDDGNDSDGVEDPQPVNVTGVTVTPSSASVSVGATTTLAAAASPSNATDKTVTWSSSDTGIATVNADGTVSGVAEGKATITATTRDGEYTAACEVTVTARASGDNGSSTCDSPTSVSLPLAIDGAGDFCRVTSGDISYFNSWNMQLVEINGKTVTNTWSNQIPARIDGKYYIHYVGQYAWSHLEVHGGGGGSDDGDDSRSVAVTGVTLAPTSASVGMGVSTTLTATVSPANATNKNVTWSSSDTGVATVSAAGVVTGVSVGSAAITATTTDGGFTAVSEVTVDEASDGDNGSGGGSDDSGSGELTFDSLAALADFPIGVAVSAGNENRNFLSIPKKQFTISQHFSQLTPGNIMKMSYLHPSENSYTFGDADELVDWADANGLSVHGHTFIWHADYQVPGWMSSYSGDFAAMLNDHVRNIATHFAGKMKSWDVVNEAIDENQSNCCRNSLFYQRVGSDYIANAFIAAKAADPGADLYYNDYDTEGGNSKKLDCLLQVIDDLLAANVPIDGVGFQMHVQIGWPSIDSIRSAFQAVVDRGLKVKISELDVPLNNPYSGEPFPQYTSFTTDAAERQKQRYHDIIAAYMDVVPPNLRGGISVWGLWDGDSWLLSSSSRAGADDWPLLFTGPADGPYEPKPACQGFGDALMGQ